MRRALAKTTALPRNVALRVSAEMAVASVDQPLTRSAARTRCVAGIFRNAALFLACSAMAQPAPIELSPYFVTATRTAEAAAYAPFSNVTLPGGNVRREPNVTVDGLLRQVPGFSLFRRSDSLVANPTTQGVSLRGLGPSGASRSLILLDGVPLIDPFGGWVLWSKVPRESLARIEIVPGAGGTAWGNAALGGVIQLFTEPVIGSRQRLAVRAGSYQTLDVEAQLTEPVGAGTLQVLGRALSTEGYHTVAEEHRGPVDVPASSRARWGTIRWRQPVGDHLTATLTVRQFADRRGNGTAYQGNSSDESFVSLALAAQPAAGFQWNATAYAQRQDFTSTFSAVNAQRTAETPASNQYAVPANTAGFAWVGEWSHAGAEPANTERPAGESGAWRGAVAASAVPGAPGAGGAGDGTDEPPRTVVGFDVRDVRGETRENSAFVAGEFTRQRFAGGRQTTAGAFVVHRRALAPKVGASLGVRADGWWETDGHRRDYLRGALVDDVDYGRREGFELSPSAGVVWTNSRLVGEAGGAPERQVLRVHANVQQAFRRPTLNELYRAFRVGNVITDGNPGLGTETVTSGEIGATLTQGAVTVGATGFWNELRDSVANVTIASGPATLPGIGFVPAGGEGRRKHNLDRTRVRGVSLEARWALTGALSFEAQYLYNDARVMRAGIAPWLVGRRLAQVPEQSASAGVTWRNGRWMVAPRVRWIGQQYEDDNNRLSLAAAAIVDLSLSVQLGASAEAFVAAENLFDERVETGRVAAGVVSVGSPRLLLLGFRLSR